MLILNERRTCIVEYRCTVGTNKPHTESLLVDSSTSCVDAFAVENVLRPTSGHRQTVSVVRRIRDQGEQQGRGIYGVRWLEFPPTTIRRCRGIEDFLLGWTHF